MSWMTARRFDWALRTRGCVLAEWPGAERDAALQLLRRSAGARRRLADALAAEDGAEAETADSVFVLARIRAAVRRALSPPRPVVRGLRWGAIAACAAAGLYLGLPSLDAEAGAALGPTVQVDVPAMVLAALDE